MGPRADPRGPTRPRHRYMGLDLTGATPVMDQLAEEGIKFSNWYGGHGCTPGRAAALTGRYPMRIGFQDGAIGTQTRKTIPVDHAMIQTELKVLGYSTAMMSVLSPQHPPNRLLSQRITPTGCPLPQPAVPTHLPNRLPRRPATTSQMHCQTPAVVCRCEQAHCSLPSAGNPPHMAPFGTWHDWILVRWPVAVNSVTKRPCAAASKNKGSREAAVAICILHPLSAAC
jgi:hypothetical protein